MLNGLKTMAGFTRKFFCKTWFLIPALLVMFFSSGLATSAFAASGVTAIAAGAYNSAALKSDGSVAVWGNNDYGQTAVPTTATSGVTAISSRGSHALALKSDGSVVAWGLNNYGQTDVPTSALSGVIAVAAGSYHSVALKSDGSVVAWGSDWRGEIDVPYSASSGVIAIAAGHIHTLALKSDGSVVAWGNNDFGQSTVPTAATSGVIAIAAGINYSLALKSDGSVVAWGQNDSGQCNVPEGLSGVIALSGGWTHTVALKSDGTLVAWGDNTYGQTTVPPEASTGVIAISAGMYHTEALKSDGSVVAWGDNGLGQTTVPEFDSFGVKAIAAGEGHTVALKSDGSVVAWGANNVGQTTVPTVASSGVIAISAGWDHTVALKSNGSVVAWGINDGSIFYDFAQTTVPESASLGVIAIAAGGLHSVALKSDGSVVAWGDNQHGQTTVPAEASSGVIAIAAGAYHTVALKSDGSVVAWGNNNYGQTTVPTEASSGVIAIAAGYIHTVALKNDGSVVAWGTNTYGQMTVPPEASTGVIAIAAGIRITLALKSDGSVVAWGDVYSYGQTPVPALASSGVKAIAAGSWHTVAVKSDGSVVAWGQNYFGQTTGGYPKLTINPSGVASYQAITISGNAGGLNCQWNGSATSGSCSASNILVTTKVVLTAGPADMIASISWGAGCDSVTATTCTINSLSTATTISPVISVKSAQTITFNPPTSMTFGDPALDLSSYVTGGASGNPVTFTVTSGPGSLNGSILTITGWGNIVITASQAGNAIYFPAPDVQGTVVVAKTTQTITFNSPISKTYGDPAFDLSAYAIGGASGNPVTFTVTSGPGTLNGSMLSITGPGNIVITASQAGNTNYFPASDVRKTITVLTSPTGVIAVAAGTMYTVALKSDGSVVAWGDNRNGQTTVPASASSDVTAIAAGGIYTVALKSDGSVVAWGNPSLAPTVPDSALSGVIAIATGNGHTLALKNDGSVVAWGGNNYGESTVPVAASSGVIAIAAGTNHSVALKSDGSVVAWGVNWSGQSTVPASASSGVIAIAAGTTHTVALKSDGSVVAWGDNFYGQCNVPAAASSGVTAIAAGEVHTMALKSDGSVVAWGDRDWNNTTYGYNTWGLTTVPASASSGVIAITAGGMHNVVLKSDGSVVAWGDNRYGQTTGGYPKITINPFGAPSGQPITISDNTGKLNCQWNGSETFGTCNADIFISTKVVLTASPADMILPIIWGNGCDSVTATTCTINSLTTNTIISPATSAKAQTINFNPPANKTYGDPAFDLSSYATGGDSGNPVTFTVTSGPGTLDGSILTITGGGNIIITANQAGNANYGLAPNVQRIIAVFTSPPAVTAIAAGWVHTMALNSDGSVVAWGGNQYGQTTVPDPALSGVTAITAGGTQSVALKSDGSVVAWGYVQNMPDSVSSGVIAIAAGWAHTMALNSDGSVVAWGLSNWSGETTVPPEASFGVIAIAAGIRHSVALKNNGSVVAWGDNSYGQTTVPTSALSGVVAIAAGPYHTVALKSDGSVVAWGLNNSGQTTVPPEASSGVIAISAGYYHTVALKSDGSMVAWGDNTYGQTTVPPEASSGVIAISAGYYHTVALKSDGSVVAWGLNNSGQTTGGNRKITIGPSGATSGQNITISGSAGGLNCQWNGSATSGACSADIFLSTKVVLTASPADMIASISWGAGCDSITATTCTINSMTADTTISPVINVKEAQTIVFNSLNKTFGNPAFDLNSYVTGGASGNPVTFTVTSGLGTLNGSILTITGAGNIVITASQAGNGNFFPAPDMQGTIVVAKAVTTVALGNLSQTYDGTTKAVTALTAPAGLAVDITYNGSATLPAAAGDYAVVATINDPNYQGSANGNLNIAKAAATITLGNLSQTYDGTTKTVTATTNPAGLVVGITYNGSATLPIAAGDYAVVATINDPNYQGTASGNLNIAKAAATITLGNLSQVYDGKPKLVKATTAPVGLTVVTTYDGSAVPPKAVGSYAIVSTVNDPNYQGSASGTLIVSKIPATITLGNLSQTYDGTPKAVSATTTPAGLTVNLTYNGSATAPTTAGDYAVVATINDPNYQGTTNAILSVAKAVATITLGNLTQTYDGTPKAASATTNPAGLAVAITYDGSATVPTNVGIYAVAATISDPNYQGAAGSILVIANANPQPATITLGNLSQTYDGAPKAATATTNPAGLAVTFTYDGSTTVPTNAGSYTVVATIRDPNYQGSAGGTLTVAKANQTINFTLPADAKFRTSVPLTATASLPVSYVVSSGPGVIVGTDLTFTGMGFVNVIASQSGDSNYNAAANVTVTINAVAHL